MVKKALFILSVGVCVVATGDQRVWIGGETGDWNSAANWEVIGSSGRDDRIFTNEVTFADGNAGGDYVFISLTNSTSALHFRSGGAHKARYIYVQNGGALHLWDKGCLMIENANGQILCERNSSIICHGENALPPHFYKFQMWGTLDMGGYSQAITNVSQFTVGVSELVVTSLSPALLTIGGRVGSSTFSGRFMGAAGICWNPDGSSSTLTLKQESLTMGELIVSNGVVSLSTDKPQGDFSHLSRAVVGSSATLNMPAAVGISNFRTDHLVLHDGANLALGANATCVLERVTFVYAGGTETDLQNGVYGASSGYLSGSGFLQVNSSLSFWKDASDGDWGLAANWTKGVPSATTGAGIRALGGDYAVTVSEPSVVTNMSIRHLGGGTAELNVKSRLQSTKGVWDVGYGGKIKVSAGAEVEYRGFDANTPDKFSKSVEAVKISGGGQMDILGKVCITNMCGTLVLGDDDASVTSKISVAGNGELFLGSHKVDKVLYSSFTIYKGGRIEVSGYGTLRHDNHSEHYSWSQRGGSMDFSDHATLNAGGSTDYCIGSGRTVFRDDAQFAGKGSGRQYIVGWSVAPAEIFFRDRAVYAPGSSSQTFLRPESGGHIDMHFDSKANHSLGYLVLTRAGYNGTADIYISDGVVKADSSYGFNQGWASTYWNSVATTGCVHQTGGAFVVNGSTGAAESALKYGFILGDSLTSDTVRTPTTLGRFELSGGVVTNESSKSTFVLGIGRGRGEFIQTGGEFVSKATDAKAPAIFGFSNGYGYYVLSNGTATISSKIWVGGVDPATCGHDPQNNGVRRYSGTSSEGGITVVAADRTKPCSFTVSDTVVLGGLGEGSLEVGPGGTFTGTDLVLSNNTASVLRLVADDSGFGAVNLSGRLTVTDGASLVVDATGFTGANVQRCNLLSCASMSGSFAPGKVTVLTDKPAEVRVSVAASGIVLRKVAGTLILLR